MTALIRFVRKNDFYFLTTQPMRQWIVDLLLRLAHRLSESERSEKITCVQTIEKSTSQGASVRIWRRPTGELPGSHFVQLLIPCEECKGPAEVGSFPSAYLSAMIDVLVEAREYIFYSGRVEAAEGK